MVIPDVNILIYAHNPGALQHRAALDWLDRQFQSNDQLGFTWPTLWGFARLATNPRIWPRPALAQDVFVRIDEWLSRPNAVLVQPGSRHRHLLQKLVDQSGAVGSLLSDAVLAAIAVEHAATLASTDRDFRRFSGLRWVNPLE